LNIEIAEMRMEAAERERMKSKRGKRRKGKKKVLKQPNLNHVMQQSLSLVEEANPSASSF